jgi:hypothetical protein
MEVQTIHALWKIVGFGLVMWAFYSLLDPPKKHKYSSLTDQNDATHRAYSQAKNLLLVKFSMYAGQWLLSIF